MAFVYWAGAMLMAVLANEREGEGVGTGGRGGGEGCASERAGKCTEGRRWKGRRVRERGERRMAGTGGEGARNGC